MKALEQEWKPDTISNFKVWAPCNHCFQRHLPTLIRPHFETVFIDEDILHSGWKMVAGEAQGCAIRFRGSEKADFAGLGLDGLPGFFMGLDAAEKGALTTRAPGAKDSL